MTKNHLNMSHNTPTFVTISVISLLFATTTNFFLTLIQHYTKVNSSEIVTTKHLPLVTCGLMGGIGNNLFQVAAMQALAWDNEADPVLVQKLPSALQKHVFSRCHCTNFTPGQIVWEWEEPSFTFCPIQYRPNMILSGYFQSEKYFAKYRNRLLQLFAPLPEDKKYIEAKYKQILSHPNSVGVQLRYYHREQPPHVTPQYGKDYLEKAMSLFPEETLFVVSSDELSYAKACMPSFAKNVIYLEGEPNYIDLYILSMCKNNIISNSSFGWWAAWLNQNPNKRVICPQTVFFQTPCQDYYPAGWTTINAKYN